MSDELSRCFDLLTSGQMSPDEFERTLLALCDASPDRAWQVLAMLDRIYRQRRITDALCRTLRQQIGARAMRLEGYSVQPEDISASGRRRVLEALEHTPRAQPPPPPPPHRPSAPEGPPISGIAPVAPEPAAPPAPPARIPDISPPPAAIHATPAPAAAPAPIAARRWARRGVRTSPAVALIGAVLGVAASTKVQDPPEIQQTPAAHSIPPAAQPPPESPEPSVVSLSSDRYVVRGHQRTLEFTVQRSGDHGGDTKFRWWTEPAGAHSGEDYVGARNQLVTLPAGEQSAPLKVQILPNPQRRHIEMFYVVIGNTTSGAQLGEIRRAAVFVFPDDME
jgi:hypothetical protein